MEDSDKQIQPNGDLSIPIHIDESNDSLSQQLDDDQSVIKFFDTLPTIRPTNYIPFSDQLNLIKRKHGISDNVTERSNNSLTSNMDNTNVRPLPPCNTLPTSNMDNTNVTILPPCNTLPSCNTNDGSSSPDTRSELIPNKNLNLPSTPESIPPKPNRKELAIKLGWRIGAA